MIAEPVKLSELVATLSLVSDLGMGRPMERVLRQTVIAMRLAEAAEVPPEVSAATYYTSLLTWVGCATDTGELAELFGDEMHLYGDTHDGDLAGISMAVFVAKHLGYGSSRVRRIGMVGKFLATAGRSVQQVMESHCQAASDLARRLELGDPVCVPLVQAFERWDGKGVPGRHTVRSRTRRPLLRTPCGDPRRARIVPNMGPGDPSCVTNQNGSRPRSRSSSATRPRYPTPRSE